MYKQRLNLVKMSKIPMNQYLDFKITAKAKNWLQLMFEGVSYPCIKRQDYRAGHN